VTEGSSTNAFMVKDGIVFTHPVNNFILNGITRSAVLELCSKHYIPFQEERFTTEQLKTADEIFITGTYIDIVPITKIDGLHVAGGRPGEITLKLQNYMNQWIDKL
jgi:D-alanine transaminase